MRITHLGHACTLLETDSARLLIDPGVFSDDVSGIGDLDAILITHHHEDHLDPARVKTLLTENPHSRLVADAGSAETLAKHDLPFVLAQPGDALALGGMSVNVVGGEHAVIHPDLPTVTNVGYVVDHGAFYHPGDSFHVPEQDIDVLGLPTAAPWLKMSEAVDFYRAVAPRCAVPIHEALLTNAQLHYGMFDALRPEGSTVTVLNRGEATTV